MDDLTPRGETKIRWRFRVSVGAVIVIALITLALVVTVTVIYNSVHAAAPQTVIARGSESSHRSPTPTELAKPVTGRTETMLIVHIVGAVVSPGIYWVHQGARVMDVTSAAGGLAVDAQPCAVNLAREVVDGEQIVIPHLDEATCSAQGETGVGFSSGTAVLVNINNGNLEQLDTLPGIGPALAGRIITWRTDNGPFQSVEQLSEVPGIGDSLLSKLADLVSL